jgi:hypothetical protein
MNDEKGHEPSETGSSRVVGLYHTHHDGRHRATNDQSGEDRGFLLVGHERGKRQEH